MEINKIVEVIEKFAPHELQESWDFCGFQIQVDKTDINKVLLCVSVTENVIDQAVTNNCDLIISHHPLFFTPFRFKKNIPVYSAHTNLDKIDGGTTDTLIELLDFPKGQKIGAFLRICDLKQEILLENFINLLKTKLNIENIRVINNFQKQNVKKIAFCAGSGADFANEATDAGADAFVTSDVKYHEALDTNVIMIDIGHFESERPVLNKILELLKPLNLEVIIADEKSPFINY